MRTIHLAKFPDKPKVLKTSIIYTAPNKICDGCDSHNVECVSLYLLSGDVSILCQDCIKGILETFSKKKV